MRRSRLVARAYNVLDTREDVHAPVSSSICNRLLPAVIMSELCGDTAIMGALDISDAYLQVDQPTQKKIVSLIVQMRITLFIGAYMDSVMALVVGDHFSNFVQTELGCEICAQFFFHYSNCQMTKGFCWFMLTMFCFQ